jgi:hypothetical protein
MTTPLTAYRDWIMKGSHYEIAEQQGASESAHFQVYYSGVRAHLSAFFDIPLVCLIIRYVKASDHSRTTAYRDQNWGIKGSLYETARQRGASKSPHFQAYYRGVKTLLSTTSIGIQSVIIIIEYVKTLDCFGTREWMERFRIHPLRIIDDFPSEFWQFWYGPDPQFPHLFVFETHMPPVFSDNKLHFATLQHLARSPQQGYPISCRITSTVSLNIKTKSRCWLVMKKHVIACNKNYKTQCGIVRKLGYKSPPLLIDIFTVLMTTYNLTGQRQFPICKSRCILDATSPSHLNIGGFSRENFITITFIADTISRKNLGMAGIRKFPAFHDCC